jgi:hypothetical protein
LLKAPFILSGILEVRMKEGIQCMSEGLMIALITMGGSGIGSLCGIIISNKLTTYRLEQLEKKVDKHNSVVERTFKLEERVALSEKDMEVANHRIKD